MKRFALLLAASVTFPACADDRPILISDFDRVRISGNYAVEIVTGKVTSAHIIGVREALDETELVVRDKVLVVRPRNAFQRDSRVERVQVLVRVVTPTLRSVALAGSASAKVARLSAPNIEIDLGGAGSIDIAAVTGDKLLLTMNGAGTLRMAGSVGEALVTSNGSGTIDAPNFRAGKLRLTAEGSVGVKMASTGNANIAAIGSPTVTITGGAECSVTRRGVATVRCGS